MDQACWLRCKQTLMEQLGEEDSAWIEPLKLESLSATEVVLSGIPNPFFQQRITTRYLSLLAFALQTHFQIPCSKQTHRFRLILTDFADTKANQAKPLVAPLKSDSKKNNWLCSTAVNANDAFSKIVAHQGISKALQFSQQIIKQSAKNASILLLLGAPGLGKTRLLQAIAHELKEKGSQVLFISGEDWKQMVLRSIQERQGLALHAHLQKTEVLLLDGLEDLLVSPRSQETLQALLDKLSHKNSQIVITCYTHPSDLNRLLPTLMSRLEAGIFCELQYPTQQDAKKLLSHWTSQHGLFLDIATQNWLAKKLNSPRSLAGAITVLATYYKSEKFSLPQVQKLLAPWLNSKEIVPISPTQILKEVSQFFSLTSKIISGRKRTQQIALARSICIYLLKQQQLSYQEIGNLLGGRTASAILKNNQRFKNDISKKATLIKTINLIKNKIKQPNRSVDIQKNNEK